MGPFTFYSSDYFNFSISYEKKTVMIDAFSVLLTFYLAVRGSSFIVSSLQFFSTAE